MFATATGPYFIIILGLHNEWIKFWLTRPDTLALRIGDGISYTLLNSLLLILPLYIISRVSLFVLVLYSLTSMPFGVCITIGWTMYFPFLS